MRSFVQKNLSKTVAWLDVRPSGPVVVALALTIVWFAAIFILAARPTFQIWSFSGPTALDLFWGSPPNEMGDTLAGLAGIPVLVWVIAATFMQRKELKQARNEYAKMAAAQNSQLKLAHSQQEDVNQEAVLIGIKRRLQSLDDKTVSYLAHPAGQPYSHVEGRISPRGNSLGVVEFYQALNKCLSKAVNRQNEGRLDIEESINRGFGGERVQVLEALWYMEGMAKNKGSLSLAGKMRQSDMKLEHSAMLLREIVTVLTKAEEGKK